MPQFFLPLDALQEEKFHLKGPEAYHIVKVLRSKIGETLSLFDGKGGKFEGVIEEIHEDGSVSGRIARTVESISQRAVDLRLYQGLLKGSHWDYVLEKGTELGVTTFIPVLTPRTVVLLREAERAHAKKERWERVVMAAAKQCQRAQLPKIEEPVEFRDAIRACAGKGVSLIAWEGLCGAPARPSLEKALAEAKGGAGAIVVNVFVGPEGGFSDEEIELAESVGTTAFGLGPRILRAETAALAASAIALYELGAL